MIIFPTTKGRYFESKDFKLIDSVSDLIEAGKVKIYCPDSVDAYSLYNQAIPPAERMKNHIWYDKMILEEVVGAILQDAEIDKVGSPGQVSADTMPVILRLNIRMLLAICLV